MPDHAERAAFYRAALLLGLVRGESVVGWADSVLASHVAVPDAFVELATIPPADLTAIRIALLNLCSEREPASVVRALLGLIGRHLASGRRSFPDTLRVLRQMRQSLKLEAGLADELRQFEIDQYLAAGGPGMSALESQLIQWLSQYHDLEVPFLGEEVSGERHS